MAGYDRTLIEDIKARCDIEDIISGYVSLKRAGSNMVGLCPFHSERTPSFTVFTSDGSFHCFGCGAGGDVISFVMRAENLDYPSAVEFLAARAGISLPARSGEVESGVSRTRLKDMNRDAARFFHEQLKKDRGAMEYLTKRALSPALIKHFGIGYAPESFGLLLGHMRSLGYTEQELVTGFLCGKSQKTGKPYDYFRGRIIFPIIDAAGNVVAFGGRVTDASLPKYLNTSDTPLFKKSRNLFALNFAKNHTEDGFILCEGYMDVVTLHGAGFENAVATLGTALTPDQARMMKRYVNRVLISYDSDEAGQRAAKRAFSLLGEAGVEARVLQMDGAKDPDEYIKKFGPDRFRAVINGSVSKFDYFMGGLDRKYDLSLIDDKVKAAAEAVEFLSSVPSEVERDLYIRRAAEKLGVTADKLSDDCRRRRSRNSREAAKEERRSIIRQTEGIGDRINPDRARNPKAAAAEEAILGILLLHPELMRNKDGTAAAEPESFVTEFGKRVCTEMYRILDESGEFDFGMLAEVFSVEEMDRISTMRYKRGQLGKNDGEVIADCINTLKNAKNKEIEETINDKRKHRA